uniref:Uncharacterized protein n=1 Tax=Rangifer tarandus platyrhynchus TaxID=3082113 RepID=A0ACB0E8F0_RANTA|nr:unnamed protein product [Rangifer tarandus platyrhynchus]
MPRHNKKSQLSEKPAPSTKGRLLLSAARGSPSAATETQNSGKTPTGEYTDEGVREKDHEDSPELATDQGQKQLCKLPWEGKRPADGHTSPRRFPGGKQRRQHLDLSRKPDLCPRTPQSKPTWTWGPQKICFRCGPRQPGLPGNEKGGEGQQSSSRAMHAFIHTHKEKNEEILLTQYDNYSHLLAAQPLTAERLRIQENPEMRKLELRPCVVEQEGLALQTVNGIMAASQLQVQLLSAAFGACL